MGEEGQGGRKEGVGGKMRHWEEVRGRRRKMKEVEGSGRKKEGVGEKRGGG